MGNESAPEHKTIVEQFGLLKRENPKANTTQVTFQYPDNQGRTAANVNLGWNAKNTTKIITAAEALNVLITQKTYLFKKMLS